MTNKALCALLGGELIGDSDAVVKGIGEVWQDQVGLVSFSWKQDASLMNGLQESLHHRTVVVHSRWRSALAGGVISYILVDDSRYALARLTQWLEQGSENSSWHPTAIISPSAQISSDVHVGAFSSIGDGSAIDHGVRIGSHVTIGDHVVIGHGTVIHSGVRILDKTNIGQNVLIYPNAVIGADGFGHTFRQGRYEKIFHQGRVVIGDNVEIGSNCTIDKGVIGDTIIGEGVKLDNLIHIAHGVTIDPHVVIAAQTGVSGSVSIGSYSVIGGQVGVVGHVHIAEGSQIQAKSGIASDLSASGKKWYGYPAIGYWDYLRSFAIFKRLPELMRRIVDLENRIPDNKGQ